MHHYPSYQINKYYLQKKLKHCGKKCYLIGNNYNEKYIPGLETAQWLKSLLYKNEDQGLELQNLCKYQVDVMAYL